MLERRFRFQLVHVRRGADDLYLICGARPRTLMTRRERSFVRARERALGVAQSFVEPTEKWMDRLIAAACVRKKGRRRLPLPPHANPISLSGLGVSLVEHTGSSDVGV